MTHIIVSWLASAVALWIVAQIIPGIEIRGFGSALVAALIIGFVNGAIGPVLKFLFLPVTFLTLGLFLFILNAFLLKLASMFTPGFRVHGFFSALVGSLILTVLTVALRQLMYHGGPRWTTL